MASVFTLKANDVLPILTVTLSNPDGSVHDLTGATAYNLNVRTSQGTFTRAMELVGTEEEGTLRYVWVTADWGTTNQLPALAFPDTKFFPMEYEVLGGTSPLTFPNGGHDWLCIVGDLA